MAEKYRDTNVPKVYGYVRVSSIDQNGGIVCMCEESILIDPLNCYIPGILI